MNAKMGDQFLVKYRNEMYDITNFVHKHPGGVNTLKGLENRDMTERFMKAPPHSDAAMYLMREYKRTDLHPAKGHNGHRRYTEYVNGNCNGYSPDQDQIDGVDPRRIIATDESMEYLVDWSKPMLAQIGSLKDKYSDWVNKPVDRPLRLFGPWYLEILTKTPWWVVPSFWVPVILYILYNETADFQTKAINTIIGAFIWTLLEYSLHRWVFHVETRNAGRWLCTFHFLMHGLHHKTPFDPYRLVFPPFPALIIAMIIYAPISVIATYPRVLLAGGLLGYLAYDMIHYYLHYGNPRLWHLYQMKRYHYQHHFVHHQLGFGISSPLWDFIFGTPIHLRKLKYLLKW